MLFNSYLFILFFLPLTVILYYTVGKRRNCTGAKLVLLLASYIFLGYANLLFPLILLLSTVCNHLISLKIRAGRSKDRLWMTLGILFNVALLIFFKYTNFLVDSFNQVFHLNLPTLQLFLPLGISFYTFQQIAFLVDTARGEVPATGFLDYCLFTAYFPKVLQGPIVYHNELLPQFRDCVRNGFDSSRFSAGLMAFAIGLSKKVLLADNFGKIVDFGFGHISSLNSFEAILVFVGYSLQIYFDFSGYCDMAIGISQMLNIELPVNFNSPYKANNINDFWKRWHITLTRFLTKYIYIPLGGKRKGKARTYRNIMIVFLISGLWHGAGYTFIIWGALHGAASILYRFSKRFFDRIPHFLQWSITFVFVSFAWTFFRAGSLSDALRLLNRIFAGGFGVNAELTETMLQPFLLNVPSQILPFDLVILGFYLIAVLSVALLKNSNDLILSFHPNAKTWLFTFVLLIMSILSISGVSTFLYSNF